MSGLVSISEWAIMTGAGGGQLECLDGEWEVVIVGIIHKKPKNAWIRLMIGFSKIYIIN